jgi:D-hydroxyproline dehydrogenase subunit alpha
VEWERVLNAVWKLMGSPISEAVWQPANQEWKSEPVDNAPQERFDVAVVGAGPAGIAAALRAAESGSRVVVIDDNRVPGGQIWRQGVNASPHGQAASWAQSLAKTNVKVIVGARVFHAEHGRLHAETDELSFQIDFDKLILATGARELFLPFPGWTLPNVFGAGGLQALAKSGLPVRGKRVVIAGTGPLLLAVAAYLTQQGATVLCICEQANFSRLVQFAATLLQFPAKLLEAAWLRFRSRRAPYLTGSWPIEAVGKDRLQSVKLSFGGQVRQIDCDYLACGFHLVPNLELAKSLVCRLTQGFVEVNAFQETSQFGVYCAGEPTGIGGLELSLIEGQIAGYAAAGRPAPAAKLFGRRARYRSVAATMEKTFGLRPELASLSHPDTLLCRCEDVSVQAARAHRSWRAAKLHSRCGMGPCQGRVCGAAAEFLFDWNIDSSRPPVFPVRCSSLAELSPVSAHSAHHGGIQ